jgi:CBS-domain-containing membrane protein
MTLQSHDIMSHKLQTVQMDDSLIKAYQIMQDKKIRHLPVMDDKGQCVGILSDRDIQRSMKTKKSGIEIESEISHKFKVQDFMSWPAATICESTDVSELAQKMLHDKISAYLVTQANSRRVKGIVTTDDLIKLLVKLLTKEPSRPKLSLGDIHDESFWI